MEGGIGILLPRPFSLRGQGGHEKVRETYLLLDRLNEIHHVMEAYIQTGYNWQHYKVIPPWLGTLS